MKNTERSIPVCIILSLVTCGIYMYYWLYQISNDIRVQKNETSGSPAMDVLLTIVTCGIYGIYLMYKWGKDIADIYEADGRPREDNAVLYMILSLFVTMIIPLALIQDKLNQLTREQ